MDSKDSSINFLHPPPRQLPNFLTRKIWFSDPSILVLLALFLLGAVLSGLIFPKIDIRSLYVRDSSLRRVQGHLHTMTPARVEEYGRSIYDYTYIFNVNDTPYQGESFDYQRKLRVGDPVTILYDDNDPHVSKIQGQRFQALGADSLGVVLVPLFMLLALLYRISTALRKVDVVRNGRYGTAKIISKTLIKGRGQRNIAYEVTFLFTDEAGEKHTGRARKAYSSTVLNGTLEPVMYLSGQPQKAVLLDTLPAVVREFIERPQGAV